MKGKNNKGFNLVTVIIIICVVSIVSGITTGVIVTNTYRGVNTVGDSALNEFLNVYSDIIDNYYEDINKDEMIDKAVDATLLKIQEMKMPEVDFFLEKFIPPYLLTLDESR